MSTIPSVLTSVSPVSTNGTTAIFATPSSADVRGQLMTVTPQMAADLLKRRLPNRPLSKARVRTMIEDMKSGKWVFNGEPLILSDALEVLDGQHRLQAVYESGITVPFMVIVGVDTSADVIMSIDQGRAKVGADMLAMAGMTNGALLSSVARWLYRYERNQMRVQRSELRNDALPAYVESRPGLQVALPWGRLARDLLPTALGAMLYYVMNTKAPALAKSYYDALAHGDGLTRDAPAHVIREKLLKDKTSRNHAGIVRRAALVTLGWNAIRSEKPLPASVTWRGCEDFTVPFPQVL